MTSPAVIIVGEVVNHRIDNIWWGGVAAGGILRGQTVAVTSSDDAQIEAEIALSILGAQFVATPLFEYRGRPHSASEMESLMRRARMSDHVLFTSARAARHLASLLSAHQCDIRELGGAKVICVGTRTGMALSEMHIRADIDLHGSPEKLRNAGDLRGKRVLWLRGEQARNETREILADLGAHVDEAVLYTSSPSPHSLQRLRAIMTAGEIDAVLWMSPAGVKVTLGEMSPEARTAVGEKVCMAAIGAATAQALDEMGLRAAVVAPVPDIRALCESLASHFLSGADQ